MDRQQQNIPWQNLSYEELCKLFRTTPKSSPADRTFDELILREKYQQWAQQQKR